MTVNARLNRLERATEPPELDDIARLRRSIAGHKARVNALTLVEQMRFCRDDNEPEELLTEHGRKVAGLFCEYLTLPWPDKQGGR